MSLPELPKPDKNELYGRFTDQQYNCLSCPQGTDTIQYPITSHNTWLYQSVMALQAGDICLFGGDFFFFDNDSDTNFRNPYYKGGMLQALTDALKRGAKVVIITDRYYSGGRDANGWCGNCSDTGKPFDCDDDSVRGSLYGSWACNWTQSQLQYLLGVGGNNLYNYEIRLKGYSNIDTTPHSHCKLISFYLKSSNRVSVFKGAWNLRTDPYGNGMKETGVGYVANMESNFGQYHLWRDINLLQVLENYYGNRIKNKATGYLKSMTIGDIPKQPIRVPVFYFCGPNFCGDLFGCGSVGSRLNDPTCGGKTEEWVSCKDTNVEFTFGVDAKPGEDNSRIDSWKEKGWPADMVWGMDLLVKLIGDSKKYIKCSIHSQMLDASVGQQYNPNDLVNVFQDAIFDALKRDVKWFALQNGKWNETCSGNPNNLACLIKKDPELWKNFYGKSFGVCGRDNQSWCPDGDSKTKFKPCPTRNPPDGVNTQLTHDKLWITDNSVLFSSAHPIIMQYNGHLMNDDLLIQKAPSFLAYWNNHINYMWYNCGWYPEDFIPEGRDYINYLGDLTCPAGDSGCCLTDNTVIVSKNESGNPYGDCVFSEKLANKQRLFTMKGDDKSIKWYYIFIIVLSTFVVIWMMLIYLNKVDY